MEVKPANVLEIGKAYVAKRIVEKLDSWEEFDEFCRVYNYRALFLLIPVRTWVENNTQEGSSIFYAQVEYLDINGKLEFVYHVQANQWVELGS